MIAEREVDLVIGTQIIAKGHHFPHLTLVGVVDADLGLSGGDLRAAERTFQLLHQVSGRAGRADLAGPGADPDLRSQPPGHAGAEGRRPRPLLCPGIGRAAAGGHAALRPAGGRDPLRQRRRTRWTACGQHLARTAPHQDGIQVLGPAPAPLALLRGRHRRRFLVKARRDVAPQPVLRHWLGGVKTRGDLMLRNRHRSLQFHVTGQA